MKLVGPTAAAVAANPPHTARGLGRAHVTNDPGFLPKQAMGPFAQARRRRDLVEGFTAALGEAALSSPVVAMHVRRAAELVTMAELARGNMLNGVPTDMLALVRLEGCASRAVRVLGLKIEKPLSGLERARRRWAQQETTKTTKTKAVKASRRGTKPSQRKSPPDMTRRKKPIEHRPARHTDDAELALAEACELLGLGGDPSKLCGADRVRVGMVAGLMAAVDAATESLLAGNSSAGDIGRLTSSVDALVRLLPKAATEAPSHREDPREALLKIIMTMRERDADAFEGYDGKVKQVEALQAEVEQLRAQLAGKPPEDSDVPTVVERVPAPAPAAKVVPLPRAAAPAPAAKASPSYDYDRERGWRDHVQPDGSISPTPFGGGRKWWGPVNAAR